MSDWGSELDVRRGSGRGDGLKSLFDGRQDVIELAAAQLGLSSQVGWSDTLGWVERCCDEPTTGSISQAKIYRDAIAVQLRAAELMIAEAERRAAAQREG